MSKFDFSNLKSSDLKKFSSILWELTEANYHTESFLLISFLVNDKELLKVAKAVKTMKDFKYYIDIQEVKHTVFNFITSVGQEKFGKENWNKYIYANL